MVKLLLGLLVVFLFSCGSSGGDGPKPINTNSSGFPDIAGRYSFNTAAISGSCDGGPVSYSPALALNFNITQDVNVITFVSDNVGGEIPGITIIEATDLSGNIRKDATFIVGQIITAEIVDIVGTVLITYSLSGKFIATGWSGSYEYKAIDSLGPCTYKTTFSGDKITPSLFKAEKNISEKENGLAIETYDSFGAIVGSESQ